MIITCLDLEFNQPSKKIIQIGYCIGNLKTSAVVEVAEDNIRVDEPINPMITELTGVTDEDCKSGVDIYWALGKLLGRHRVCKSQRSLWTWGGGDTMALMLATKDVKWPFAKRYTDVKTLYFFHALKHNLPIKGGLKASMASLGLQFDGDQHRAANDAVNTFKMACKLFKLMA